MQLDYANEWRNNQNMRIILAIFLVTIYVSASYAASDVNDRRIEEEKRRDLKTTEANFYQSPSTTVEQEALTARDFLASLNEKAVADHQDAAQVLSILLGKEKELIGFKAQREFLVQLGLLSERKSEDFIEKNPLRRGLFAQMLIRALGIKGGLTLRVVGPFERYALSDLAYEDIMISGSTGEWMSGRELIYTFIQASNYISRYKAEP